ncbi:MAG: aspartate carbamoyltransferase [Thermofilaceae archaeon]|nr:aspartate carbamoyltransferase [Thermofilaceae archaeon]MDW8004601.1 aspartate carbamoyltransferase [Thermofilaceae archaeon]
MFLNRDVISIIDFNPQELERLFDEADLMLRALEEGKHLKALEGYVMATAFFEPSTRTKMSFQTAMIRLGGSYIDLPPEEASSRAKGENLADTVRMLDSYADVIVIRHRVEGAARFAAEVATHPVINGGDGTRDHPTQAMIDLYTVRRLHGMINGLVYGVIGDLRYGRAARSFILGLSLFKPKKIYLISPPQLSCKREVIDFLNAKGVKYEEVYSLSEVVSELDVLYVTRIQRERFPDPLEFEKVKGSYKVSFDSLKNSKEKLSVLHPLPRVDELAYDLDNTAHARYFEQAKLGVPVRMALLKLVLKG